jgi:hypothetical protein
MEIRWRVARIRQRGRLLPFLIEDVTPRSTRVPGGLAAEHPNGATGICRLELAALIGDGSLRLGACVLSSVAPDATRKRESASPLWGPDPWWSSSRPEHREKRRNSTGGSPTVSVSCSSGALRTRHVRGRVGDGGPGKLTRTSTPGILRMFA